MTHSSRPVRVALLIVVALGLCCTASQARAENDEWVSLTATSSAGIGLSRFVYKNADKSVLTNCGGRAVDTPTVYYGQPEDGKAFPVGTTYGASLNSSDVAEVFLDGSVKRVAKCSGGTRSDLDFAANGNTLIMRTDGTFTISENGGGTSGNYIVRLGGAVPEPGSLALLAAGLFAAAAATVRQRRRR